MENCAKQPPPPRGTKTPSSVYVRRPSQRKNNTKVHNYATTQVARILRGKDETCTRNRTTYSGKYTFFTSNKLFVTLPAWHSPGRRRGTGSSFSCSVSDQDIREANQNIQDTDSETGTYRHAGAYTTTTAVVQETAVVDGTFVFSGVQRNDTPSCPLHLRRPTDGDGEESLKCPRS